jgi:hypothetical protein
MEIDAPFLVEKLIDSVGFLIAYLLFRMTNELNGIKAKLTSVSEIVSQHRAEIGIVKATLAQLPCYRRGICDANENDKSGTQNDSLGRPP